MSTRQAKENGATSGQNGKEQKPTGEKKGSSGKKSYCNAALLSSSFIICPNLMEFTNQI